MEENESPLCIKVESGDRMWKRGLKTHNITRSLISFNPGQLFVVLRMVDLDGPGRPACILGEEANQDSVLSTKINVLAYLENVRHTYQLSMVFTKMGLCPNVVIAPDIVVDSRR